MYYIKLKNITGELLKIPSVNQCLDFSICFVFSPVRYISILSLIIWQLLLKMDVRIFNFNVYTNS